jgi:hypothetical protein
MPIERSWYYGMTYVGDPTLRARPEDHLFSRATLTQSFWRGGEGFSRSVPIRNGTVQWTQAEPWSAPLPVDLLPGAGDIQADSSYLLGGELRQSIWRGNEGFSRAVPIVDGVVRWSQASPWSGPVPIATLPGDGAMEATSSYLLGRALVQSCWRGGEGRSRSVPVIDGVPQWGKAAAWRHRSRPLRSRALASCRPSTRWFCVDHGAVSP